MTSITEKAHRMRRSVSLSVLVSLFALMTACSTSSSTTDPGEALPEATTDVAASPTAADEPSSTSGNDRTSTVDPLFNDAIESCGDDFEVGGEIWPDLDQVLDATAADQVRNNTLLLRAPHPNSCQTMNVVDGLVDPSTFGAVESRSLVHDDPYVRFDLFVFESREARDASGAQETIRSALGAALPANSELAVVPIGDTLVNAESWINSEGVDRAPRDTFRILSYYFAHTVNDE